LPATLTDAPEDGCLIIDLAKQPAPSERSFDVCIAGAGSVGIALSVELAAKGVRVALLEAGGQGFELRSQNLCYGESGGLPFNGLYNGRCRMLGGTTTLWGGQIMEVDDHVFRGRDWIPGSAWPITKQDLTGAYARAIELEGLDGALTDPAVIWRALSLPPPALGEDLYAAFSRWCPVTNFARLHANALRSHPNIRVFLHASVRTLEFEADGETLRAVRASTQGRGTTEILAKRFVLAVGGIETNRLLLQPDLSTSAAPWARAGLVGRSFQDHISCYVATVSDGSLAAARYFDYVAAGGFKHHAKIKMRPEAQERIGTLDVCGTIAVTTDGLDDLALAYDTYRLWQTRQLRSLTARRIGHFVLNLPKLVWQRMPYSGIIRRSARNQTLRLTVHCEQSPRSTGQITLGNERDALGLLRARVTWRAAPLELHTIRAFLRATQLAFQTRGLGEIVADPGIEDDDGALTASFRESYHHIGGARMAVRATDGVVDPHLRVFGTRNLYICSSAVFPSAGFANPTHTLIALSVRLANHLAMLPAL
jgi:choline dehydrogenase-like flavoprotein